MKFSALAKPFTKAEPVPLEADVYVAVATLLLVLPLAAAMALTVVVVLIVSAPEYSVEAVVGVEPSVLK